MSEKEVRIKYTNYKGETHWRHITPEYIHFGKTEFHEEPQWLLHATDVDKQAPRDFAMKDIISWGC